MQRNFDAIVIGSGLGGLTAAALCVRAGMRVLVLERNDDFGGAATVYRHGGLSIEASLHEMDGLDAADPKAGLFRALGIDRDLEFVDTGPLYEVRGAVLGAPFTLPRGPETALSTAISRFPQHAAGLEEYFRRLVALRRTVSVAAQHETDGAWWLSHPQQAIGAIWQVLRERNATVGEVLRDLFGDDEAVKFALAGNLGYYHDDPERMLFLRFAIPQASYLIGGGHYIRGGSQALTDRLVGLIREAGGVLEPGREAVGLAIEHGAVAGVTHCRSGGGDARMDRTQAVLGNAAPDVLAAMLPEAERARFLSPYAARRRSVSLWTISLGLNRPATRLGVRVYATHVFPAWMRKLSQLPESAGLLGGAPGDRLPAYSFVDYSLISSGLNQQGTHLASLCGLDRLENWEGLHPAARHARKEAWMDCLIADLNQQFPGIAAAVVHREMATAETMRRFLNTPGGAVYGFAPEGSLAQARPGPATATEGLWLASAYTMSGGFTGAMLGGAQAARALMSKREPAAAPAA